VVAQDGIATPVAVVGWSKTLRELHRRIGHRFARSEAGLVSGSLPAPDRPDGRYLPTVAGPLLSRSRMALRIGSDRAENILSSVA
jgi:hypothetical protein